jgi:hypothetical protein
MLKCDSNLTENKTFPWLLKKAIKVRGLTYGEASIRIRARLPTNCNLSHVSLWNYANGKSRPWNIGIFQAICDEFNIDPYKVEFDEAVDLTGVFQVAEPHQRAMCFNLKDAGRGLALISFAGEIEWSNALEIAHLLLGEIAEDAVPALQVISAHIDMQNRSNGRNA